MPAAADTPPSTVGLTGARFAGAARRPAPAPAPPPAQPVHAPRAVEWPIAAPVDAAPDPNLPVSVRVRPYVLTGGRTRAAVELELETLVSAGPHPPRHHHDVVALCRKPISVAEVAALMGVPIGVARVMVGDLAAQHALVVHEVGFRDVPDAEFLQRVLTGLRRL